jgi:type II secretory pathway pseudopilin PulG
VILRREGITLVEIIVVLVIIGLAVRFLLPNFTTPNEQAWAVSARNNLLAIYSAQLNYMNNNGSYCTITTGLTIPCGDTLSNLNLHLSLNIQDDGTYLYNCANGTFQCTATRTGTLIPTITLTLNTLIKLDNTNPHCVAAGHTNWCP